MASNTDKAKRKEIRELLDGVGCKSIFERWASKPSTSDQSKNE